MKAWAISFFITVAAICLANSAETPAKPRTTQARTERDLPYPPKLPGGREAVTDTSGAFLKASSRLGAEVTVAKTAPTIDFAFFPGQNYPGKPWSAWGDSLAINGKYYASIGDHLAPGGNAFV